MLERLGIEKKTAELRLAEDARWGTLEEGAQVSKGEALFPRVETAGKKAEKPGKAAGKAAEPKTATQGDEKTGSCSGSLRLSRPSAQSILTSSGRLTSVSALSSRRRKSRNPKNW